MSDINEVVKEVVEEAVVETAKEHLTAAGAACMVCTIVGGVVIIGGTVYGTYKGIKHLMGKKKDKAETKPDETKKEDENFEKVEKEQQEETE